MNSPRIGFGFDVHPLEEGAPLFLGGTVIPSGKGAVGHSDADVLIHAIIDALLGACAMGDIGTLFPDSDMAYKGADSRKLLGNVMGMIRQAGYEVTNIDTTVCLQEPKIAGHVPEIRKTLAETMEVEVSQVSVKATTTEGLGYIGAGQGISAYAVVLVCNA